MIARLYKYIIKDDWTMYVHTQKEMVGIDGWHYET